MFQVSKKSDIRQLLNDKLVKLEKEDENIEAINRMMAENLSDNKGITADVNESDQQVPANISCKTPNIKLLDEKSASEDAEGSTSTDERDTSHNVSGLNKILHKLTAIIIEKAVISVCH